jgi:hypothetical protein
VAVNHRVRGSSPCWGAKKLFRAATKMVALIIF